MFGKDFKLENDEEILKINSPQEYLNGPYVVVYKNITQRWAIVAFDYDDTRALGIRWFHGSNGNPVSRGYATWFVIPTTLANAVLNGLPLESQFRDRLNRFLAGEIDEEGFKNVRRQ